MTEPLSSNEIIYWRSAQEPPDADTRVLVFMPTADDSVDFGSWDGEQWSCETLVVGDQAEIVAWAHVPEGRAPGLRVTERERLRAAQSKAVMPLIGSLLDAWDGLSNDLKLDPELEHFARLMTKVHAAMEDSE